MAKKVFTEESFQSFVDSIKSYINNAVSKKANASHTHTISNIDNLQTALDSKSSSAHSHSSVTTSAAGFMTASDKFKLDGITENADSV